jgi:EAL domain-containing protein (putative c-di-GMP-specific phosphodiesterase class I)
LSAEARVMPPRVVRASAIPPGNLLPEPETSRPGRETFRRSRSGRLCRNLGEVRIPSPAISAGVLALAAYWTCLLVGMDTPLVTHWAFLALLAIPSGLVVLRAVRVREGRLAWASLGAGLSLWTLGWTWLLLADLRGIAVTSPGPVDALWLTIYPCTLLTFAAFARPWLRRSGTALGVDVLMIVLVGGAVVTAFVLPQVTANKGQLSGAEQLVFSAYPIADSVLLTLALVGAVVAGRRAGAVWMLFATGIVVVVTGDILWTLQAAAGTWQPVMGSNSVYPLWPGLAAVAAWLPRHQPRPARGTASVRTHAAVLVAVLTAIVLLAANEWVHVPATSVVLAALGLLGAVHRTVISLAASVRDSLAAARERDLVEDVGHALKQQELELHYQPLVDAHTGAVVGAEALLRWQRDGTNVPPDQFLPAVECSELMAPLTDYVLDRALAEAATWGGIGISVNLATANLSEPDLPARVIAALRRHGVPPSRLTLEITETAAVEDSVMADHVLAALDTAGVALSVDDFGTGHSSIVRLARFPICEVKIDRCFVREMHTAKRPIVATTIELAHALGLRVVAEGIEDHQTLLALRELGCDLAQGYHLSRPLTAAGFAGWLAVGRADLATTSAATGVAAPLPVANLRAV